MKTIKQRYNEVMKSRPNITVEDFFFEKIDNYTDKVPEFLNSFSKIKETPLPSILWTYHREKPLLCEYHDDLSTMQNDIMLVLWANRYKIEGLYESIGFEYNPLDNTDYTLETTTNYGQKVSSETQGRREDSQSLGSRSDSETLGQRLDKVTDGSHTDTTTNKVAGFNSESMSDKDSSSDTYGEHITDSKVGEQINNATIGAQSNSSVKGEQTNGVTEEAHSDTVIEKKHGNIGVTSTSELIQGYRDIVDFNVWVKIAQMIIDTICMCIYESEVL